MNYDAIIRRARKAVKAATDRIHSSKVHIVDQDTDIQSLSGLVVILSDTTQHHSQNMPADKISAT